MRGCGFLCKAIATLLMLSATVTAAIGAERKGPVPVVVFANGDDGLTLRFRETLEASFHLSKEFVLDRSARPGTLRVTIVTNVDWRAVGNERYMTYQIDFLGNGRKRIGSSSAECPEQKMIQCASIVLKDAKQAAGIE